MAYQQTEKTIAHKAAQKTLIIGAAIDIIGKNGFHALTAKAVVTKSNGSMGKLYNLFPDMAELIAQVEATVMHRDRLAIEKGIAEFDPGVRQVVNALATMFDIFCTKPVSRELMSYSEAYVDMIVKTLGQIIGASGQVERNEARDCARAALGVIFAMAPVSGPRAARLSKAVLFALRGLGVSERKAQELAS
jgi:AcrR family transcriptional regulator